MKAKIYSQEFLIGTTDLSVGDESMGCVFGEFEPTELYFEKVQKEVREFWKSKKVDYNRWESMRFNAQLENGLFLFPSGGYTFADMKGVDEDPIRIDLAGIDFHIIENNFTKRPLTPFVENPWSELQISQKIVFEDELAKEVGITNYSFLNIFKGDKNRNSFKNGNYSAFCRNESNDDVLFEIHFPKIDVKFVLVHLTWIGKKEQEGYPKMKYFKDFNEFVELKMIPDKLDWES